MKINYYKCFFLFILFLLIGCGDGNEDGLVKRPGEPDYYRAFDEGAMDKAIEKARTNWPQFVNALESPNDTMTSFAIKKGFRVGDNPYAEHIWLNNVSFDGKIFKGEVNNEPVDTTEVKFGDIVEVKPEDLSDWMYVDNGILKGGYTLRVLMNNMSLEEREQLQDQLGFRVEE